MIFVTLYQKITKKNRISIGAFLNGRTILEGYNVVLKNALISNSKIGYSSIISTNCNLDNCVVGRFSSIGAGLNIVNGAHPTHTFVSTHPAFYSALKQSGYTYVDKTIFEELSYYDKSQCIKVKIGNDVWIGINVTIMGGIEIGDGAVIATGAVVTKNVRPYSVVGGVPAKEIRRRFTDDQVAFLMDFKWWDKPTEWIKQNAYFFQDIERFIIEQTK